MYICPYPGARVPLMPSSTNRRVGEVISEIPQGLGLIISELLECHFN